MRLKIACVGEAMIELSPESDMRSASIGYAGDSLNSAIYLKRNLSSGNKVSFVTVLGADAFSHAMLDYIRNEDINCDLIGRREDKLPGIYAISKDETGDRTFSYWRGDSAARTLFSSQNGNADFSTLNEMDVVYLSAITLAILPADIVSALFDWIENFKKSGGRFAFDSNFRPSLWPTKKDAQVIVARAWSLTDIALPSIDDEMALFDDESLEKALDRLSGYQVPVMAVKRGAKGPLAIVNGKLQENDINYTKAENVVDTTSAGDSFNGAFLASILQGQSIEDAMLAGHNMAIEVIGHQGAIIPKQ